MIYGCSDGGDSAEERVVEAVEMAVVSAEVTVTIHVMLSMTATVKEAVSAQTFVCPMHWSVGFFFKGLSLRRSVHPFVIRAVDSRCGPLKKINVWAPPPPSIRKFKGPPRALAGAPNV